MKQVASETCGNKLMTQLDGLIRLLAKNLHPQYLSYVQKQKLKKKMSEKKTTYTRIYVPHLFINGTLIYDTTRLILKQFSHS